MLECLEHANKMCLECSFEKRCGEKVQSNKCNFIKITDIKQLVDDETAKAGFIFKGLS